MDDRCVICGSREGLRFTFPIPTMGTAGYKLCREHQEMMYNRPNEFLVLLKERVNKKKGARNE